MPASSIKSAVAINMTSDLHYTSSDPDEQNHIRNNLGITFGKIPTRARTNIIGSKPQVLDTLLSLSKGREYRSL